MFPPPPPVFSLLPLFFSSFFFLLSKMMALRQRKAPVLYGLDDENDGTWDEDHYATTSTGKAKPSRTILTRISSAVRDNFSQFSSNFSYNFSYSFLSLSLLMMTSSRAGAGKRSWFWLQSSLWPSWSNWIIWRVQTKSCALLFFFSSFFFFLPGGDCRPLLHWWMREGCWQWRLRDNSCVSIFRRL